MEPQTPAGGPGPLIRPETVPESRRIPPSSPPRSRGAWWLLLLFVFLGTPLIYVIGFVSGLVGSAGMGSESTLQESYHSLSKTAGNKVAIIAVEGTILDGEGYVKQQIDRVREDKAVKAVVVRIDSPGGTVTGSDYIHHHLVELAKERQLPMVVSMGGMAASGGYYVAMAVGDTENTIFAEPTTWTGSIGVIIPHYDFSGLMERFNVAEDSIKSHPLKQMGSPTRPMTEQERAIMQALVDDSFSRFKEIIKSGRPHFRENSEALDGLATGQVFTTSQAIAGKLVDKEGYIEEAIDRAIELAALNKDDVKVIEYERPFSFSDLLLASQGSEPAGVDLSALLELTAPKAYYLCTWLPAVAQR
jgi:protease-4